MYRDNYKEEQEDIKLLVNQYEEMLRTGGGIGFFERREFTKLINYYEARDQVRKALVALEYALEQHAYSATFYIRKAQFLMDDNREAEALELLEQAELYDSSEIDIYLLKADIMSSYEKFEEALDILEAAEIKMSQSDMDELYLAYANVYEDMEQYDKMYEALQNALLIDHECEEALERIWLCTEFANKYEESISLHNQILDINPYSYMAWYNLGHAFLGLNAYDKAAEAFEFAYTIQENFELAYIGCGEALLELEDYEGVIQCFKEGLSNLPRNFEFSMFLGRAYEAVEDYHQAKIAYIKAAKINDRNGSTYYRLGECYAFEDKWVHALSAFESAWKLEKGNSEFIAAVAEANYQLDNNEKADELFKEALDIDTTNTEIWVQYISFLIDVESFELALEAVTVAEEYCETAEIQCCKVASLFFCGKQKAALSLLEQLLMEDRELSEMVLELFPDLKEEPSVINLLAHF